MLMFLPWVFLMGAVAGILVQIHDMRKEQELLLEDERSDRETIYSLSA